ncbi:hypothetical protein [Sphingobium aromaticivastans]|uniref:hypothetical protein n=2 Tax=Sphingobium TaxID=165695 RepID=UPI00159C92AB
MTAQRMAADDEAEYIFEPHVAAAANFQMMHLERQWCVFAGRAPSDSALALMSHGLDCSMKLLESCSKVLTGFLPSDAPAQIMTVQTEILSSYANTASNIVRAISWTTSNLLDLVGGSVRARGSGSVSPAEGQPMY